MLTVDANVWIAAADHTDVFYEQSRSFLNDALADSYPLMDLVLLQR